MSRQSNSFQRLIYVIESLVAKEGWKVTESVRMDDPKIGIPREIDVAIQAEHAGLGVTIAIECRDRKRADDIEWIDAIRGKYESLPVSRPIFAVSKSGLTEGARRQAREFGIELLTLKEAENTDWRAIFSELQFLTVQTYDWSIPRQICSVGIPPDAPEFPNLSSVEVSESKVFSCEDQPYGSLAQVRDAVLGFKEVVELLEKTAITDAESVPGGRIVCFLKPSGYWAKPFSEAAEIAGVVVTGVFEPGSFLVTPKGERYRIGEVELRGALRRRTSKIALNKAIYRDIAVASGAGTTAVGEIEMAWIQRQGLSKLGILVNPTKITKWPPPRLAIEYTLPTGEKGVQTFVPDKDI